MKATPTARSSRPVTSTWNPMVSAFTARSTAPNSAVRSAEPATLSRTICACWKYSTVEVVV